MKLRLLIGAMVIGVGGTVLTSCGPVPDVQPPPGGCGQQHAGWVATEPNRHLTVFPYNVEELAEVDVVAGWYSSGWGAHCSGWQVGDPFLRPGSGCSGNRSWAGFVVIHQGGCGADSYEGPPWSVTWVRESGTGYFWSGGGAGAFDAFAMLKAHNNTPEMEHNCWTTGSLPSNSEIFCRHQHEW